MIITVNDLQATIKADSSFEYISENRLFLGRDGYTLALTFPLKDCPENRAIFGNVDRLDVVKKKLVFPCLIQDRGISLSGSLLVTSISQSEIKGQFSEGRCEQTVSDPFEDTFINQLDLGRPSELTTSAVSPINAWRSIDNGASAVALPWVNDANPLPIQNLVEYENGVYRWSTETTRLSWQPYLIVLTKRICAAVGYEYDFTDWEKSEYRHLIVCNTLPFAWDSPDYATALPLWSVSEFFEKLELFMSCEFDFDHKAKTVRFSFSKDAIEKIAPEHIEKVVDSYECEISKEEDSNCDYIGSKNVIYKDASHQLSNYYSCDWAFKVWPDDKIVKYDSMAELLRKNPYTTTLYWGENLTPEVSFIQYDWAAFHPLYAKDIDTYFVFRSIGVGQTTSPNVTDKRIQLYMLQPINMFGSRIVDDDIEKEEIEFVPPCIDYTEDKYGHAMILSFSSYDEKSQQPDYDPDTISQLGPAALIESGSKDDQSSYYDLIYVGVLEWQCASKRIAAVPDYR